MKQNLADWLNSAHLGTNRLLISAGEECAPLVNNVLALCQQSLNDFNCRQSFSADRYFNLQEIQGIVTATSLFGDKNFIGLTFKSKPNSEQQRQLLQLLPLLGEDNFLCISCDRLDKKELASEWITALQENGVFLTLTGDYKECLIWARHLFTHAGFTIDNDALELLLTLNQNNFAQLYQEITKLCLLFKAPTNLGVDDISSNLLDNAQYNIFELANAYLQGKTDNAIKIFHNVCQSVDEAILIMWNVGEDLRKLIRIKGRQRFNPSFTQAIDGLRIWGEGILNFQTANQRLVYSGLLNYFDQLAQVDLCIKGVVPGEPRVLLEKLIINICLGK